MSDHSEKALEVSVCYQDRSRCLGPGLLAFLGLKHWPILVYLCVREAEVEVRHISGAAVTWSLCSGHQAAPAVPVGPAWESRPLSCFLQLRNCPAPAPRADSGRNLLLEKRALFVCSGSQHTTVMMLETRL